MAFTGEKSGVNAVVNEGGGKEGFFTSKKIGTKLMTAFLCLGLIPFLVLGVTLLNKSSSSLEKAAFNQLEGIREIKKKQIEGFFHERQGDLNVLKNTVQTLQHEAYDKIEVGQTLKKKQVEEYFHSLEKELRIFQSDPQVIEALGKFSTIFKAAGDRAGSPKWLALAKKYDERFRKIQDENGWYDIFMINLNGDIVYSVGREVDLGMNIQESEIKTSSLGRAFDGIAAIKDDQTAFLSDFAPYAPSHGAEAAFMLARVVDPAGRLKGYTGLQVPVDKINHIVQERHGMGRTGESYLVGEVNGKTYLRSDRVVKSGKIGKAKSSEYISMVMEGKSGVEIFMGSSGALEVVGFAPVDIHGLKWGIITSMSLVEAIVPVIEGTNEDFFTRYIKEYGYYDLFLIGANGDVFYSAAREADYHTNMVNGKFSDSGLGELTRQVLKTGQFGFADFKPYAPSHGDPASFIAQPILHGREIEFIVGLQLSDAAINSIMKERTGLGETGETYLIGPDKLMRSDSFLDPENRTVKASFKNPELGKVDTEASRDLLRGNKASKVVIDYNGAPVLSSYTPVNILGTTWGLLAEIDEAEAFGVITTIEWMMGIIGVIGLLAILAVSILVTRSITVPIRETVTVIKEIATGDFTKKVVITTKDEMGELGHAVNGMVTELKNMFIQMAENSSTLASSAEELTAVSTQLSSGSEEMSNQASNVAAATEQMSSNIGSMASAVEQASVNSSSVSSTAEQMSANMNTIASAIEEMTVSISDISSNARETAAVATEATKESQDATETMKSLGVSANEIGKVTEMIKRIAEQTNLLALNATIEAASAGEAGKGFAVVANEIKELANQSAQAAEDIASKIEGIQSRTNDAVHVIAEVSKIIGKINSSVEVINTSVEQQSSSANEISSNVNEVTKGATNIASSIMEVAKGANDMSKNAGEAASGATDVSSNIQGISKAIADNGSGIRQVDSSAKNLAKVAGDLKSMVAKFKVSDGNQSYVKAA